MPEYLVPGVFVEELSLLPPAVAEVESAVPAFVGYTAQARREKAGDLRGVPQRIRSLAEFESLYGKGAPCGVRRVNVDKNGLFLSASIETTYCLYDALRLFYANGGGDCYIVSVGGFAASGKVAVGALLSGLQTLATSAEVTVLLCPDAVRLGGAGRARWQQAALAQCAERGDRFAVFDLAGEDRLGDDFRQRIGMAHLKYGAAYAPWLLIHPESRVGYSQLRSTVFRQGVAVSLHELTGEPAILDVLTQLDTLSALPRRAAVLKEMNRLETLLAACFPAYRSMVDGVAGAALGCPPSGALAGVYARVDRERGVWKAPANVVVNGIAGLAATYSTNEFGALASDAGAGKSINPIRQFPGKGWLVWGARTLAGNDNEWRYVPVRRFCSMVETSIRQATSLFVFEPNDASTWVKVSAMIENYLTVKWRDGALLGARPEQAFYVKCGLAQTMTAQDVLAGRMIVEVGLAMVRPAEFIVLRFMFLMSEG